MRKLLKLVVIGALLAVGPIQAFAVPAETIPSDAVRVNFNSAIHTFLFVESDGSDKFVGPTGALVDVPHPLFSISNIGGDPSTGSFFLVLSEGSLISDVLRAVITTPDLSVTYNLSFDFFDSADSKLSELNLSCGGSVTCLSEAGFNTFQNVTSNLGLGGTNVMLEFRSDTLPVPEPEIYAMMGIGLALMGFVARRRKGLAAAA